MGTSLLQVLRTVALDADARSAFEDDPNGYLSQYGYQDVPLDDLEEAVGLMADTLPPDAAMEIAPDNGDPGLIGALRGETGVGHDPLALDGDPPGDLATAFGDADFDGGADAPPDPSEEAEDDTESGTAAEADDDATADAGMAAESPFPTGPESDELVDEVGFGSGSLNGEPLPDGPAEIPGDDPTYDDAEFDTGFEVVEPVSEPAAEVPQVGAGDDPSFDEAEAFSTRMDGEALDHNEPGLDDLGDIGSF